MKGILITIGVVAVILITLLVTKWIGESDMPGWLKLYLLSH